MDKSCKAASSQNLSSICFLKGWTSPDTGVTNSSWAVCGQHSEAVLHNTLKCSPCVCVCACTHMCMHVCALVWGRPTWVYSLVAFYLNFETGYLKIPSLKFTLWLSGWLAKELHGSTCFRAPPPHPSTGVAYMCPQLWLLLEIHTWVLSTMLQTLKKPSPFR